LTGVGSNVDFIDQSKKAPYVQQMQADFQYQLTDSVAVSVGFAHARGDDLGLGGTNDAVLNINQIRPEVAAQYTPAQLTQQVPNPFFGVPGFGPFSNAATLQRGQLLRPFPQFGNINMRQSTLGKSRYNALILKLDKRVNNGFGGRFNYTWSTLKDNQFGESNHFQGNFTGRPQDNYNLDAEYSTGLLDTPHRIVLAPIFELPFGQGKRWAQGGVADAIVGGWTLSAVVALESGFPTPVRYQNGFSQSHLGNFGTVELRPNPGSGDPNTSGSWEDRVTGATPWANSAAYTRPTVGQLGTLERTDTNLRSPFRRNLDFVANKSFRTGGSTRAEVRLEFLNLTNTPKFRDFSTFLDQATFGQITRQSGFSRITQVSLRFSF
jgi:hypothetical protein